MKSPHSFVVRKVPSTTTLSFFVVGVICTTFVFTLLLTPYYRSRVRILLVQQYAAGMDPYNISKATEYYTNLLAEVVLSRAFFHEVVASDARINEAYFPSSPEKREILWRKLVNARPVGDTGILTITVHHPSRVQAEALASAIAQVFATTGTQFHGAGDRLAIRTIDDPVTSENPVSPLWWLNVFVAFMVACCIAVLWRMRASAAVRVQDASHEEEYFLR